MRKNKKIIKEIIFIVSVLSTQCYAETIPSIQKNNFKIGEAVFLSYKDKSIIKPTWKDACSALKLTWSKERCMNQNLNTIWEQLGDICADGSFKVAAWGQHCEGIYYQCPNASWTLSADKSTCSRSDNNCKDINSVSELKLLAAIAYGESSTENIYKEMAGIASAVINARNAWNVATVKQLIEEIPRYSYVISNDNQRYKEIMCTNTEMPYKKAFDAAANALNGGRDYSNGGCFWDGMDLKTEGKKHYRYLEGFRFTKSQHNIFNIQQTPHRAHRTNNGVYYYVFDSTAAYGKTTFWKYNQDFINVTGVKQCR